MRASVAAEWQDELLTAVKHVIFQLQAANSCQAKAVDGLFANVHGTRFSGLLLVPSHLRDRWTWICKQLYVDLTTRAEQARLEQEAKEEEDA